jgi:hypothetical protein
MLLTYGRELRRAVFVHTRIHRQIPRINSVHVMVELMRRNVQPRQTQQVSSLAW